MPTASANPLPTLATSLQYVKGVGPERYKVLKRLELYTIGDLLYFFPRRYENRTPIKKISELSFEDKECVSGTVLSRGLIRTRSGQTLFRAVISDGGLPLFASWFNQPYLHKVFPPKTKVCLYGKAEREGRQIQMLHPEYELLPEGAPTESIHTGRIVPVYSLTEDLSQKALRQLLFRGIEEFRGLFLDPLPPSLKKRQVLTELADALKEIHFPQSAESREKAYRRLVFDEFFLMQLLVQLKKARMQKENELIAHKSGEDRVARFLEELEFELTGGQKKAVDEILSDMKSGRPMNRLVQGDVGSGKTVVAASALFFTALNGFQGALMAPTEVLAQQHYFTLTQLLGPLGIRCGYVAQNISPEEKERVLARVSDGTIQIVIGTHSLIQQSLKFHRLGLAVIDEQHKFGVFQRAALKQKAVESPHFLLMTATPIPRTLALTLYGDLDVTSIAELPKGRKKIKTFWVGENSRAEIYRLLESLLEKDGQGYVICPWIDDTAEPTAKSVAAAHGELSKVFAHRKVGFLHGRMKGPEKKKIMQDFKEKKLQLLVSTVVIEVGIDVPDANVMIIENAEKFGLAQLHQLRGRVGRGTEESFCFLFSGSSSEETTERLDAFQETQSGFDIAEKDLELRGAGEIVGEKQHGLAQLRIGDLAKDFELLQKAKSEAKAIIAKDPELASAEHRRLRAALKKRYGLKDDKKMTFSG